MAEKMLRVYGKKITEKRFHPFCMYHLRFVTNLIHSSMFPLSEEAELKITIDQMNIDNPKFVFEIREFSM